MTVSVNPTVQSVIQIKNGMMKHVIVNVKTIIGAKKNNSWNPGTDICENNRYLRITSIGDGLLIACDEIIYVMEFVSPKRQIL